MKALVFGVDTVPQAPPAREGDDNPLLVGLALDRWGFDAVFAGMAALGGAPLVAVLVRRSASRQASR